MKRICSIFYLGPNTIKASDDIFNFRSALDARSIHPDTITAETLMTIINNSFMKHAQHKIDSDLPSPLFILNGPEEKISRCIMLDVHKYEDVVKIDINIKSTYLR